LSLTTRIKKDFSSTQELGKEMHDIVEEKKPSNSAFDTQPQVLESEKQLQSKTPQRLRSAVANHRPSDTASTTP